MCERYSFTWKWKLWIDVSIQRGHLIPSRTWYTTTRPIPTQFSGHWWLDDLTTDRSFRKLTALLMCLAHSFDMLAMGFCTTRHWQMSGRLVPRLNVWPVAVRSIWYTLMHIDYRFNRRIFFLHITVSLTHLWSHWMTVKQLGAGYEYPVLNCHLSIL